MTSKAAKHQRLKESKLKRAKALSGVDLRRDPPPPRAVVADHAELAHNNTYDLLPKFYIDRAIVCRQCGTEEVWPAERQKWWYEVAKGNINTDAVLCRSCRASRKAQKTEARRVHLPRCSLDHLAIVAPSLSDGVAYVQQTLGVTMQVGGEHPRMGTHNYFLKLGDKVYLEVISINPAAPRPDRARWFQLDEPDLSRPIRLATWIARIDDIYAAAAASPVPLGDVEPMSRGPINWLFTIPKDGRLPLQGIAPALIQWPPGIHPTSTLQDMGCSLVRLEAFHSNTKKVNSMLEAIGFEGELRVSALPPGEQPYLVAHIQTPTGPRQLSSPN